MRATRRQQFLTATIAWLALMMLVVVVGDLSLEIFYITALFGFIVILELTAPSHATPEWRQRLWWFVAAGLLIFGVLIIRRAIRVLPSGFEQELLGML